MFLGVPDRTESYLQWEELLPKVDLGPDSRHLFGVPPSKGVNYVKLNMYPDGGIVSVTSAQAVEACLTMVHAAL